MGYDGARVRRPVRDAGCGCACLWFGLACAPSLEPGWADSSAACQTELAPHDVQGTESRSALEGHTLEVHGVVTLAFEAPRERPGFFLQSLEADADARSSEGLFVALAGRVPAAGTHVRVRGRVSELGGWTALDGIERLDECGRAEVVAPAIALDEIEDAEAWEGAWVEVHADWAVVDTSARAELRASPAGRLYASGHELGDEAPRVEPWTVHLPGLEPVAAPRLGARRTEITGVLGAEVGRRQLYPSPAPAWAASTPAPPARARGSACRVAALNLDNYFLDLSGSGARSEAALLRQRDKLAVALAALDADVLALTELENRGDASLAHLIEGLNARLPSARRYAFSAASPPGSATLRAGIAYRPASVELRGEPWFDARPGFSRPPLFQPLASGARRFTLGVVHFKSKRCSAEAARLASGGCGDAERREEAALLMQAAQAAGKAAPGEADTGAAGAAPPEPWLVMGDFNSDAREAPLAALAAAGFVDLLAAVPAAERYSYVFEGRASQLDHALAWGGLTARGAAIWHINADEPLERGDALDSPLEGDLADARRCSDHDPIVVDL